jgi:LysM repeat protein
VGIRRVCALVVLVVFASLFAGVPVGGSSLDASGPIHYVRRGETLFSISRLYGVSPWTIASSNGIVNPNRIYVGQRLVIPSGHVAGGVHVVQRGEILYGIARLYGVDAWSIARANGITNINRIYVGQRLVIPGYYPVPAPPPVRVVPPPTPQPAPPSAEFFPGSWWGEYFDNVSLSGTAYAVRWDEAINFDWGWGAPIGGLPGDWFSVRWTGTFDFGDGGTYRLYAKVDDGVRVYVDDHLAIDGWRDGGLRQYSADRDLSSGEHTIKVEYYERSQVARVYVWWKQVGGPWATPGPTPTSTPAPTEGWACDYFNNVELAGSPAASSTELWIGFKWGSKSPAPGVYRDYYSMRCTTTMHLTADHYRFCAMSDDGARIRVDDALVLDEWHGNNGIAYCGTKWVSTGNHEVKVEYYEDAGDALLYVWWEPQ